MAARRDLSGIFERELQSNGSSRRAAVLDSVFHLTDKGMTFVTDTRLPEWTEVRIEMRLPGTRHYPPISCRGVVVQCTARIAARGYEVTLLFLGMNKRDQAQLSIIPAFLSPASISISH